MVYLESIAGAVDAPVQPDVDERAARRALRAQIARLERELAAATASAWASSPASPRAAYPRLPAGQAGVRVSGPRLLGLGELERIRDDLAARVADVRDQAARQGDRQAAKRVLIERMLLHPGDYKWVRVSNADIGEPGCKSWHVVPRLGLVGMLAGWWHVKISSGCPLATS